VVLPAEFHELAASVRNWARWGDDDEVGTLNLITDEVRRAGAACVQTGKAFSLALPLDTVQGIQIGVLPKRVNPVRTMTLINEPHSEDLDAVRSSDDVVHMALQAATHWDGLAHVSYGGRIWNGYPADTITAEGATRCGIHRIQHLTSRGVLLDVARAKGLDALEGGYAVTADDLDAALELAKLEVRTGDVVLVRTGQLGAHLPKDKAGYVMSTAGLGVTTPAWFHARDVAAVATDTFAFEVWPWEDEAVAMPVHMLHLVEMGMTQGQNWVLDALADDCAEDGRYDFFLEASPQPFVNAVGSPVNPVAIK
jgi:kynurenine formamidase